MRLVLGLIFIDILILTGLLSATEAHSHPIVEVLARTGGPAPVFRSVAVNTDGTVEVSENLTDPRICPEPSTAEQLKSIQAKIHNASLTWVSVWAAGYSENFDDVHQITFILQSPPEIGLGTELSIPAELFPVSLLPVLRAVDAAGVSACGESYEKLTKAIPKC